MHRKLLGERAEWDLQTILLRNISHSLAGANWQRGGGRGQRPQPIKIPDGRPKQTAQQRGDDMARRLTALGLMNPAT